MTTTDSAALPAAWYPCPEDAGKLRWWDGAGWTEHTVDRDAEDDVGREATQPAVSRQEYRALWLARVEAKPAGTPWVWLFAAVPLAQAAAFALLVGLSPDLALAVSFGIATLGNLVAAMRDSAALAARDHRTVGWVWAVVPPVYLGLRIARLGRSSIGPSVLWAVAQLAALAAVVVVALPLFAHANSVAEYDGAPAAGASAEPLTADRRADLLTPAGMGERILADLRAEGSVVDDVVCPSFGVLDDAELVTCRVEMQYATADVDVQVTDGYENVAFVVLRFHYDE